MNMKPWYREFPERIFRHKRWFLSDNEADITHASASIVLDPYDNKITTQLLIKVGKDQVILTEKHLQKLKSSLKEIEDSDGELLVELEKLRDEWKEEEKAERWIEE